MCNDFYEAKASNLLSHLNEKEKITTYFDNNNNSTGNAALYAIPKNRGMSLNNREMATLLHVRTLQRGSSNSICSFCGDPNHLAHDLSCRSRSNMQTANSKTSFCQSKSGAVFENIIWYKNNKNRTSVSK